MLENFLSKKRAEMVNKLIPSYKRKGRILDIGCGEYPYFLINTEFKEKYGVDRLVDNKVLQDAGRKDIFIKKCDIIKDGFGFFEDEYFDVVTMLAVFEHIEPKDLSRIIGEIKRVLKFNGVFILTTPAPWSNNILQVLSKLRMVNSALFEEHKDIYDFNKIISVLTKGGFAKEDIKVGRFELFMNIWSAAVKK